MAKDNAEVIITNYSDAFGDDSMEFKTKCGYYEKDSVRYIMYNETDDSGMKGCAVMIKVDSDEVTVTRKGDFSSKMPYKNGQTTEFTYRMPYGSIPVTLKTKKIRSEFNDEGGILRLFYSLTMQGESHEHSMTVKVKCIV